MFAHQIVHELSRPKRCCYRRKRNQEEGWGILHRVAMKIESRLSTFYILYVEQLHEMRDHLVWQLRTMRYGLCGLNEMLFRRQYFSFEFNERPGAF